MKTTKLKGLVAKTLLFLLIFDLKVFSSVGSSIITFTICFLLLILNNKLYFNKLKNILFHFRYFFILFVFVFVFVLARVLLSGVDDISYLLTTIKTTSIVLASLLYLVTFGDKNILKNIFIVFFINALICLFFGTFPNYKFLLNFFQYPTVFGTTEIIGFNEYRNAFLAGSGYFGISSLYAIVFPIALYYVSISKDVFSYLKLFFIMLSGVLAGRVALVCYFITVVYFSIVKRKFNSLFYFAFFVFCGGIIIQNFEEFSLVNSWISELFLGDSVNESNTIIQLQDMFYFPSEMTLIFGDGKYKTEVGGYYGGTDVGYMRNILFGGVFFYILMFLDFLTVFRGVWNFSIVYILIFLSMFLHFKGVFIFNNPGFFPIMLSISYYLYLVKRES